MNYSERSLELHRQWRGKLEVIATLSGWKTYSVFRRHFTDACGLSPSEWRAANVHLKVRG